MAERRSSLAATAAVAVPSRSKKDDDNDEEAANERQRAKASWADAVVTARDSILKGILEPAATKNSIAESSVRAAFDILSRSADRSMTAFHEAEADIARHKIAARASMDAKKLEDARLASDIKLKQKDLETRAACDCAFEEKLKDIARDGNALEQELGLRLEAQSERLKHLQEVEDALREAQQQLGEREEELRAVRRDYSTLTRDAKEALTVMKSSLKHDLSMELKSVSRLGGVLGDSSRVSSRSNQTLQGPFARLTGTCARLSCNRVSLQQQPIGCYELLTRPLRGVHRVWALQLPRPRFATW